MEAIKEDMATFRLVQDKNGLVLYGSKDIHLPGLLDRVEKIEDAIAYFQSQRTLIKGMAIGLGVQGIGMIALLKEAFS